MLKSKPILEIKNVTKTFKTSDGKALTACKFSKDPQRPYYCKRCFGYHTTSETKEQYYDNLEKRIKNFEPIRTDKNFKLIKGA